MDDLLTTPDSTDRLGPGRLTPPRRLAGLLLLGAALLCPAAASAQGTAVDEGTFLLSRNGRAVGTESFTIRRSGRGEDVRIIATGEATVEIEGRERRISSALEASGPEMRITAFQVKEAGDRRSEVYLTLTARRFRATLRSPDGEELREYRADPAVVVLDEALAHHHHFVAARATGESTRIPAIAPRTGRRFDLRITDAGRERVSIAGRMVQARRLRVEGGGEERELWTDDRGRILLVVNHTTGFRAERRNPPG